MAVTVHCDSVQINANGRRYVNFDSGDLQMEFENLAALTDGAGVIDADSEAGKTIARNLLLRHWLAMDPTASNTAFIVGKKITFDMDSANAIVIEDF